MGQNPKLQTSLQSRAEELTCLNIMGRLSTVRAISVKPAHMTLHFLTFLRVSQSLQHSKMASSWRNSIRNIGKHAFYWAA